MIKRKSTSNGINAQVGIEPNSAAQSNNNFSNNIYVQTPYPAEVKTQPSSFTERDVQLEDIAIDHGSVDVRTLILETYANILLDQDKTLIANLISKHTIIVPVEALRTIISCIVGGSDVDIGYEEDNGCCAAKVSPIQRIDYIKIITDSGEIITDFKQVFNREFNELTLNYHLNLKYVVIQ